MRFIGILLLGLLLLVLSWLDMQLLSLIILIFVISIVNFDAQHGAGTPLIGCSDGSSEGVFFELGFGVMMAGANPAILALCCLKRI